MGKALEAVLLRLALMMVADGEGATKVMRLSVLAQTRTTTPGPWPDLSATHPW